MRSGPEIGDRTGAVSGFTFLSSGLDGWSVDATVGVTVTVTVTVSDCALDTLASEGRKLVGSGSGTGVAVHTAAWGSMGGESCSDGDVA